MKIGTDNSEMVYGDMPKRFITNFDKSDKDFINIVRSLPKNTPVFIKQQALAIDGSVLASMNALWVTEEVPLQDVMEVKSYFWNYLNKKIDKTK